MDYKRIGEFSKFLGISNEFLKFYDKKDLVKPIYKDDASYRYYADYQTVHLLEYQQFKSMGISLEEAKEILSHYSLEERLHLYEENFDNKIQEFQRLLLKLEQLEDITNAFHRISEKAPWHIEPLPIQYFHTMQPASQEVGKDPMFYENLTVYHVAQHVTLKNPALPTLENNLEKREWGAIISPHLADHLPTYYSEKLTTFANCPCFLYEHSIPAEYDQYGKLSDQVWSFAEPLEILKKQHFSIQGELYQKRYGVTHEKEGAFVQVQTIIPLALR